MRRLAIIIILLTANVSYLLSQEYKESDDLFKIGTTPFIYTDSFGLFFSYGVNYGSVGMLLGQWMLPKKNSNILFREYKLGLAISNRIHLVWKVSKSYSTWFGYSYLGVDLEGDYNSVGIKWKLYESDGYYPDYSLKFSNHYKSHHDMEFPIAVSLGSARNKFKYYISVDIKPFYYIPIPNRFSLGVSYEIFEWSNVFTEFNREPNEGWSHPNLTTIRSGINFNLSNLISLDISHSYFNFNFTESIPFRGGLTGEDPTYIISVPEKDSYHLLSGSINIYISRSFLKYIF